MREKYRTVLAIVLAAVFLWAGITSIIYRFANPAVTETQAFLHIPQSMMLNFKE